MRITLDYDGDGFLTKMKATCAWLFLKAVSRGAQYGRKSSDSGIHLKAHGLPIKFRTVLMIRLLLFEDKRRVKFDVQRLKKPKQLLFSHKGGKSAGEWKQSLVEVII